MKTFTREQVLEEAKKRYKGGIDIKSLDEAMQEDSFEEAVETLVCESQYLNGDWP
jgi:hypothetical protein